MKRFQNNTAHPKNSIAEAIAQAEQLLQQGSNMMFDITLKTDWKFNAKQVPYHLLKPSKLVNVYLYKPWNPWTAAIGFSDSYGIHINSRKLSYFSHHDLVGLMLHEFSHQQGFHHGNNYKTTEKCLYSVPYYLSENIHRWI